MVFAVVLLWWNSGKNPLGEMKDDTKGLKARVVPKPVTTNQQELSKSAGFKLLLNTSLSPQAFLELTNEYGATTVAATISDEGVYSVVPLPPGNTNIDITFVVQNASADLDDVVEATVTIPSNVSFRAGHGWAEGQHGKMEGFIGTNLFSSFPTRSLSYRIPLPLLPGDQIGLPPIGLSPNPYSACGYSIFGLAIKSKRVPINTFFIRMIFPAVTNRTDPFQKLGHYDIKSNMFIFSN